MTQHVYNSISPPWYQIDRFREHFKKALGSDWTMKDIRIENLEFRQADDKPLPMVPQIRNTLDNAGTIHGLLLRAYREKVPMVWLHADVKIEDS